MHTLVAIDTALYRIHTSPRAIDRPPPAIDTAPCVIDTRGSHPYPVDFTGSLSCRRNTLLTFISKHASTRTRSSRQIRQRTPNGLRCPGKGIFADSPMGSARWPASTRSPRAHAPMQRGPQLRRRYPPRRSQGTKRSGFRIRNRIAQRSTRDWTPSMVGTCRRSRMIKSRRVSQPSSERTTIICRRFGP